MPAIQQRIGTCSSGARYFRVKYIAPELGYAEAISAMLNASAQAPAPPIIQLHMIAAAPPAWSPYIHVDMRVPYTPEMLIAKLKLDHVENSRLKTCVCLSYVSVPRTRQRRHVR